MQKAGKSGIDVALQVASMLQSLLHIYHCHQIAKGTHACQFVRTLCAAI